MEPPSTCAGAHISDRPNTRGSRYETNNCTKKWSNVSALARSVVGDWNYSVSIGRPLDRPSDPTNGESPVPKTSTYKSPASSRNSPNKSTVTPSSKTSYTSWNPPVVNTALETAATNPGTYANKAHDILEGTSGIDWKSNWNRTVPKLPPHYAENTAKARIYNTYSTHTDYMGHTTPASSVLNGPRSRSHVVSSIKNGNRVAKYMKGMSNSNSEANAVWRADNTDLTPPLEVSRRSGGDRDILPSSPRYLAYSSGVAAGPIDPAANICTTKDMSGSGRPIGTDTCYNINTLRYSK